MAVKATAPIGGAERGKLLIISGPAGAGKGEVVKRLIRNDPDFRLSVSMTSRPCLAGETEGVNYYYVSEDEFSDAIARGELLEYTRYCGNYYGTPKKKAMEILEAGKHLLLEIDVDGATQIKKVYPDAVLIMVIPPNVQVQEHRLRSRGRDTEESIRKRLARAREEFAYLPQYDYVLVNYDGHLDEVCQSIRAITEGAADDSAGRQVAEQYFTPAD